MNINLKVKHFLIILLTKRAILLNIIYKQFIGLILLFNFTFIRFEKKKSDKGSTK